MLNHTVHICTSILLQIMVVFSEFRLAISFFLSYFLFTANGLSKSPYSTGIYQLSNKDTPSTEIILQTLHKNYFPVVIFKDLKSQPSKSFFHVLIIIVSSTDSFVSLLHHY